MGDPILQYNLDGFLTTKTQGSEVTHYSYTSLGELLSVTLPDGRIIEYINDPLGRRIAKKVNGVIVEKYLWQGLTRLLAVYDGSNNLVVRFQYADVRMPVAMTKSGATYYLTYDQVGSLRVVADASGNVIKRIDYDSFGSIIDDTNPTFTIPFGFAGGLHDRETGLVRFGFRDYDPDTGRWIAKDPIGFRSGDVDLYRYVANNPVNRIDPRGRNPLHPSVLDPWFPVPPPGQDPDTWNPMDPGQAAAAEANAAAARARAKCHEAADAVPEWLKDLLGDAAWATAEEIAGEVFGTAAKWGTWAAYLFYEYILSPREAW